MTTHEPVGLTALTIRNLRSRISEQAVELDRLRKIEHAARTYFTVRGLAVITAARALQDALALPPGVVPELPTQVPITAEDIQTVEREWEDLPLTAAFEKYRLGRAEYLADWLNRRAA